MLDSEAQTALQRRIDIGVACLRAADPSMSLDSETAAKDAISDILTAVVGPAGVHFPGGVSFNGDACNRATTLLDDAYSSWEGDAEDYEAATEPGDYGYEEPDVAEEVVSIFNSAGSDEEILERLRARFGIDAEGGS